MRDSGHENGSYLCSCAVCQQPFVGHKRRQCCWACAGGARSGQCTLLGYIGIALAVLAFLLMPLLCHAAGEREMVRVLAARVRDGIAKSGKMPDAPPNLRLNNLPKQPGKAGAAGEEEVKSLDQAAKAASAAPDLQGRLDAAEKARDAAVKRADQLQLMLEEMSDRLRILEEQAKPSKVEAAPPPPAEREKIAEDVPSPPRLHLVAPVSVSGVATDETYHLVALSLASCIPCRSLHTDIGEHFTVDGATVHVDWVDAEKEPNRIPSEYRNTRIVVPILTYIGDQGRGVRGPCYIPWPTNKSHIVQVLRARKADRGQPVAATGSAGFLTGVRPHVIASLEWFDRNVHGPIEGTWDSNRNDGKGANDGLPLLHADTDDYKSDRIYGTLGSFSVRCPGGIEIGGELFEQLDITYKSIGTRLEVTTSFAIEKSALAPGDSRASPKGVVGAAEPRPMKVVDPSTALMIFSMLNAIWQIAHPELDLQLPGRMQMTVAVKDGAFAVTFKNGPRIRAKAYWEWLLSVSAATVSPVLAHLEFGPQPGYWFPIRSRDLAVN